MIDRNAQMRSVGASRGSVMRHWICQYEAPSIAAASCSFLGNALEPGEEQDHRESDVLPGDDHHQRPDRDVRIREPVVREESEAHLLQQVVERTAGLQHQAPSRSHDDLGDHVGDEDEDADQRLTAHPPVEQEGEQDRRRPLEDEREDQDEPVVRERVVEQRILQDREVVLEPDEVGRRAVALPAEEPVVARHQHREDDEGEEDEEGRPGQKDHFQPGGDPMPLLRHPGRP